MKRVINSVAIFLIVTGLSIAGWSTFQWGQSQQAVQEIEATELSEVNESKKPKEKKGLKQERNFSTLATDNHVGDDVAQLIIPKLGLSYDVYWGTDEDSLQEGVGMYVSEWTTVPNAESGHTVLSGHRETVFTKLGELEDGDLLTVKYQDELYQYEINKIWITDPDDRSVIVKKEKPTLTLTTCYPFQYFGLAPERYIVQAEKVN